MAQYCPRCGGVRGQGTTRCWEVGCGDTTPLANCASEPGGDARTPPASEAADPGAFHVDAGGATSWVESPRPLFPEIFTSISSRTPVGERQRVLVVSEQKAAEVAEELSAAKVRRSLLRTVFLPVALWTWAKGSPRAEPIPIVRLRDARFAFDFSGEPRDGTLYVVHPYNPARYVPIAKVAEVVERERLNAYTQILADAGAKSIQVVSASVVETSASAGAEAPIEQSGAQLGLEFKRSASGEVERATRREYAALGGRMVRTPDQWPTLLEDESELRSVLHQRMNNGLVKAMVSLTTKNSEELSPELRGQVDKLKLSLGGDFKAASSVKWTFEVQFWPLPK